MTINEDSFKKNIFAIVGKKVNYIFSNDLIAVFLPGTHGICLAKTGINNLMPNSPELEEFYVNLRNILPQLKYFN